MKNMLCATIVALSIASIGSAYAGAGDRPAVNTQFTEILGVLAPAPMQDAPSFEGFCHVSRRLQRIARPDLLIIRFA